MNFRILFFIIALSIFSKPLIAQKDNSKFESLLCKEWIIKYYEDEDGEIFQPSEEHLNDLMIFYNDNKTKSIENMLIKNGDWQYDVVKKLLIIIDTETKEKSVMKIIKLNVNECVLEYKDKEGAGLKMHLIPKV